MSTNGVSSDVFHLLYESEDDDDEFELNNRTQYAKAPLINHNNNHRNAKSLFKTGPPNSHPVLPSEPPVNMLPNDSVTVASRNGIIKIPKGTMPPSMVRSRSSGKVAETSFFGADSMQGDGVRISRDCMQQAEEAAMEADSFVYKKMHPTDTIQGIALQYHTTIAEVKRLNNLISDQDFFGLKHIKVPTTKHSVLHETHSSVIVPSPSSSLDGAMAFDHLPLTPPYAATVSKQQHQLPSTSTDSSQGKGDSGVLVGSAGGSQRNGRLRSDSSSDLNNPIKWMETRTVSINQAMSISADLLQSDLSEMCSQAFSRASTVEVIQKSRSKPPPSGADWGIRWQHAVGFMLILCVAAPILYLVYKYNFEAPTSSTDSSDKTPHAL